MTAPAQDTGTGTGTGTLADRARQTAELVADRLADPARTASVASREDNRDPVYDAVMWGPVTLANGLPGTALLYGELARDDARWRTVAHQHITAAAKEMPNAPSRGLFSGPAALLAAVQTCAGPEGHYATLRGSLARWLAAEQTQRLDTFDRRADSGGLGVDWGAYDLINGLSGTARLLLDAAGDEPDEPSGPYAPSAGDALERTLRHLVRLTGPIDLDGHAVPGWWVPPELQLTDRDRADYPLGDLNLGMAHGITGPLAVLCAALAAGREVSGQRTAIERIASWLVGWTLSDDTGPYWPARVGWAEEIAVPRPERLFTRTAWCYGAPGVAVALHRAGELLGRPDWSGAAVAGLRAALARDEERWAVDGPTVCHGYAGLLQTVARVAAASGDPELVAGCRRLAERTLDFADPDAPFVFRHLMRYPAAARSPVPHRAVDTAGMLEGAAGVACALLTVTGDSGLQPERGSFPWDRCLGLA